MNREAQADPPLPHEADPCEAWGPNLARLAFEPDTAAPEALAKVKAHVAGCARCQETLRNLKRMGEACRASLPEQSWTTLWPEVFRRLREELRPAPQPSGSGKPTVSSSRSDKAPATHSSAMGIRFLCDHCGKKYEVLEKFAGRKMKCAKCEKSISVPMNSTRPAIGAAGAAGAAMAAAPAALAAPAVPMAPAKTAADDNWDDDTKVVDINEGGVATVAPANSAAVDPDKTVAVAEKPRLELPGGVASLKTPPRPERPSERSRAAEPAKSKPVAKPAAKADSGRKPEAGRQARQTLPLWEKFKRNSIARNIAAAVMAVLGIVIVLALNSGSNPAPSSTPSTAQNPSTPKIGPLVIPDAGENPGENPDGGAKPDEPVPLKLDCAFPGFGQTMDDVSVRLAATGGLPPYKWTLGPGSKLPDGLKLEGDHVIGFSRETGDFKFTLIVTDRRNNRAELKANWVCEPHFEINAAEDLEDQVLGKEFTHQFKAKGGKEPYTWKKLEANLPGQEVAFDESTATISGKPTRLGRFSIRLQVTDARQRKDELRFRFEVQEPEEPPQVARQPQPQPQPGQPQPQPQPGTNQPPGGNPLRGTPQQQGGAVSWGGGHNPADLAKLSQLNMEGCDLMRQGKYEESIKKFEDMLKTDPRNSNAMYNLACAYSLQNKADKAMEYLEAAVQAGFTDLDHINTDTDLANVRNHPKFKDMTKNKDAIQATAAQGQLAELKKQFPTYLCKVDDVNKFVFATNQSEEVLKMLTDRIVTYARAQWRDMFKNRPDYYITIVLPSLADYDKLKPSAGVGGWYNSQTKILISSTIGYTLTHEFTHALHFGDTGKRQMHHNIWFTEGLATLFEDSKLPDTEKDSCIPVDNARLRDIKFAVAQNQYTPWRQFFAMSQDKFMEDHRRAVMSYAQCRYICIWLYEQKKHREFYEKYCETFRQGPDGMAGITAMEKLFGKKLEELEEEWKKWVTARPMSNAKEDTYIGVQLDTAAMSTGLRVAGIVPDSPADRAGLKVGDIIVQVDGRPIDHQDNFKRAFEGLGVGDAVKMTVIRDEVDEKTGEKRSVPKKISVRLAAKK